MNKSIIGKTFKVKIDRPMGSYHPEKKNFYYPVNYGYIPNIIGGDGEEQDVYVLGVDKPLKEFTGKIIAIIHRLDDVEDKWVMVPNNMKLTKDEILEQVNFQEKFFKSTIKM